MIPVDYELVLQLQNERKVRSRRASAGAVSTWSGRFARYSVAELPGGSRTARADSRFCRSGREPSGVAVAEWRTTVTGWQAHAQNGTNSEIQDRRGTPARGPRSRS